STFGNINTNAVLSLSSTNGILSVPNTDKFQAKYGLSPNSWSTIGYVTNNPHISMPRIEFRYESGFINGDAAINKRLNVDAFRFTFKAARPQFSSLALSGTNLVISGFDGVPNASYNVLTSTNVALPITNWDLLLSAQFDSIGNFGFTNAISPDFPQRF